ncbi:hypothetical protein [Acidaminococcus provencensis]|uniref:hypothetical protein n=1 Tax=Acidaminococcus provencensis TaxID=2058289 RepID=UPI000CF8B60F|nr:hypothetical protein [Acidaminococcus provencensis]
MEVKVKLADDAPEYGKVATICKRFSLGQTSARNLIHQMQRDRKWKKGVIAYGRMLLINIRMFEAFLISKSY